MTIKILIADDHQIMRQGLKSLLEKQGDLQVIGEAENGREVMKMVRELSPDIIVMDISMPDLNGIDATRRIVAEFPNTKVVALSIHSDRRFVAQMIEAGATGYILKENAFEELAKAIRVVNNNQTFLCPKIASIVTTDYINYLHEEQKPADHNLSGREREILQLIAEGNSTKVIAGRLFISVKTVETHRRNIMEKLNLNSVAELTKYAIREGLTSLN